MNVNPERLFSFNKFISAQVNNNYNYRVTWLARNYSIPTLLYGDFDEDFYKKNI